METEISVSMYGTIDRKVISISMYGTIDRIVISILMCDTIYWIVISILMYGTIDWIVIAISMYRTIYRIVIAISLYGIIYWTVIAISMFCCTGWVGCPPLLEKMTWRPYRTSPAVTGSSLRRRSLRSLPRPRTSSDDSWSGDLSKSTEWCWCKFAFKVSLKFWKLYYLMP